MNKFSQAKRPCRDCGKLKSPEEYHWLIKDRKRRNNCKVCYNEAVRARKGKPSTVTRTCCRCDETKPLRGFDGDAHECKACAALPPYTPPPVEYPRGTIAEWGQDQFEAVMAALEAYD